MGSVVIVVMQPSLIGRAAGLVVEVGVGVCPLRGEGAVEPFDLAVGLRLVGLGPLMGDLRPESRGEIL